MANQQVSRGEQGGTFRVLRIRNYRLIWPAMFASAAGRMMWAFVSSYLIFKLTGSAFLAQMVAVTFAAPQFLLGIFSGSLADAYDRRKLMLVSLILMGFLTLLTALLTISRLANPWIILGFSLAMGVLFTLNNITRRTFTFDVVGRQLLPNAMAMDNIAMTIGTIIGPMISGLLIDLAPGDPTTGAAFTYFAIAGAYVAASLLVLYVRPDWTQETTTLSASTALTNMGQGISVVAASSALVGVLGITVLFNIVYPPSRTMLPVFGDILHINATSLGLLGASQGVGALIGAFYLATRGTIKAQSTYYWVGSAIATGLLAVFAIADSFPVALIALTLGGIGQAWFGTMQATLVMLSVPDNMRGRVMGILSMAIGVQTLGALLLGTLAEVMGPGAALLWVSVICTTSTLIWAWLFKAMRKL